MKEKINHEQIFFFFFFKEIIQPDSAPCGSEMRSKMKITAERQAMEIFEEESGLDEKEEKEGKKGKK